MWAYLVANYDPAGVSDVNYGGTIEFTRGIFTFTNTIADLSVLPGIGTTGSHRVKGQGFGTRVQFLPSSTQDAGFRINGGGAFFCGIEDMRMAGNDNVTNLIRINGNAQQGILKNLDIRNSNSTRVTGQRGIYIDTTTPDVYYWYFNNLHFRYFDQTLDMTGSPNAVTMDVIKMQDCNKGIRLTGGLHQVSNIRMQATATVGDYAVSIGGNQIQVVNVWSDGMTKAGAYPVIIEAGTAFPNVVNVFNSSNWTQPILDLSKHYQRKILISSTAVDLEVMSKLPSMGRKQGVWYGVHPTAADALLGAGFVLMKNNAGAADCTTTLLHDTTHGEGVRYTTTTAEIGANAGIRSLNLVTNRNQTPRLKFKFKLGQTTNTRGVLGLAASVTSDLTGNDPLNTLAGFGIGWIDTDTQFKVLHNDSSGVSVFDALTTPVNIDLLVHTVEITSSTTKHTLSFDNSVPQEFTTNVSAANMGLQMGIEASAVESKSIDLFWIELETVS